MSDTVRMTAAKPFHNPRIDGESRHDGWAFPGEEFTTDEQHAKELEQTGIAKREGGAIEVKPVEQPIDAPASAAISERAMVPVKTEVTLTRQTETKLG